MRHCQLFYHDILISIDFNLSGTNKHVALILYFDYHVLAVISYTSIHFLQTVIGDFSQSVVTLHDLNVVVVKPNILFSYLVTSVMSNSMTNTWLNIHISIIHEPYMSEKC